MRLFLLICLGATIFVQPEVRLFPFNMPFVLPSEHVFTLTEKMCTDIRAKSLPRTAKVPFAVDVSRTKTSLLAPGCGSC